MTPERTFVCFAIAAMTGVFGALGAQLLAGIATGDLARALGREPFDLSSYWLITLPVCYLVAGVLGYVGPVRTWRWIVTMIAIQPFYTILVAGSGLSLLPFALAMVVVLCLPGVVTARLGARVRRHCDAAVHS